MYETYGFGYTSSQGNSAATSGLGSMVGGVVGGVVGGEAGWKLFNEGSSVVEEGVVIFVTHQNALMVGSLQMIMKIPTSVCLVRLFLNQVEIL